MREFNELRARQVIAEAFYRAFWPFDFRKVTFVMHIRHELSKGAQRESSHVKSRYRGNTIIQTESSYTAQKTRTIYAFLVPILTKPLPRSRFLEKSIRPPLCYTFKEGSGVLTAFCIPWSWEQSILTRLYTLLKKIPIRVFHRCSAHLISRNPFSPASFRRL